MVINNVCGLYEHSGGQRCKCSETSKGKVTRSKACRLHSSLVHYQNTNGLISDRLGGYENAIHLPVKGQISIFTYETIS